MLGRINKHKSIILICLFFVFMEVSQQSVTPTKSFSQSTTSSPTLSTTSSITKSFSQSTTSSRTKSPTKSIHPSYSPSPSITSSLVVSTTSEQYQALRDLYDSTNGPNWRNNTNWMVGTPCSNKWFGVTCSFNNIAEL